MRPSGGLRGGAFTRILGQLHDKLLAAIAFGVIVHLVPGYNLTIYNTEREGRDNVTITQRGNGVTYAERIAP